MPGRLYEAFTVGETIAHPRTHTITQDENEQFCRLTLNAQPLHIDPEAAKKGPFGKLLVNGLLTFSLGVGMSVEELTAGTLIANLGYTEVQHPNPVFPGDTITASSHVLLKRRTRTPGRGLVTVETKVTNQRNDLVCQFHRTFLVKSEDPEATR
jgi:acyl dehydratase